MRLSLLPHLGSLGRLWRARSGVAAAELAVIAPVLVVMLVTIVDYGLGVYRKMQVQNAADAGAEYAVLRGFSQDSITTVVVNATSNSTVTATPAPAQSCGCPTGSGFTQTDCASSCPSGNPPGTYVTVSAQGTYSTILPYPGMPKSYTFTATSVVRIQ